jgi:hypothetical protein
MKTGSNLVESSKEGCGSKRAILPTVMVLFEFKPNVSLLIKFYQT